MGWINGNNLKKLNGMLNLEFIKQETEKQWKKKHRFLENLTNENKENLSKIDLKLLKDYVYFDKNAEQLWKELKKSKNITKEQHDFAKHLYYNYALHSLKKMGFD